MATSTKPAARAARKASAIAAAALGVTAPLLGGSTAQAATSGAGLPFMYRSRDTITANCTGGTHEVRNLGNRALGRYEIFAVASFSSSMVGDFLYSRWQQIAATVADKQLWCVGTDYYWQYYAANAYHREITQDYFCNGGCQWIGNYYTAWSPGY